MSTYSFESQLSVHEGGSKYYQVILVTKNGRKAALITHWGTYAPGAELTPRWHGQSKLMLLASGGLSAYNTARRNKEKRGYKTWENTGETDDNLDYDNLQLVLTTWLKRVDAAKIVEWFDGIDASDEENDDDDTVDFDVPIATQPDSETMGEWGTW